MEKQWRDIGGYEGRYQVSNIGEVRSLDRITTTKKGERKYKGQILTPKQSDRIYLVVNLSSGRSGIKMFYVHRLVALAFLGVSSLQVNHKDLDKLNNNVSNLEYVTNYENSLHARSNGVKTGKTKLSSRERKEIREERKKGVKLKILAERYEVSLAAISEVANKRTWSWE